MLNQSKYYEGNYHSWWKMVKVPEGSDHYSSCGTIWVSLHMVEICCIGKNNSILVEVSILFAIYRFTVIIGIQ